METTIQQKLSEIEQSEGIRILYCAESGSRAWGFASTNSDYDVRFIYARPLDWYLSISPGRDVVEYPIDDVLDINGWDVKKALGLLRKGNPPLLEWLGSPIKYRTEERFYGPFTELAKQVFNPLAAVHHYLGMSTKNKRHYLGRETVRLKKYLYVLRSALAAKWVIRTGEMAPTPFMPAVEAEFDPAIRPVLDQLLERKQGGEELLDGPPIPELEEYTARLIEEIRAHIDDVPRPPPSDVAPFDRFFRMAIREAWGDSPDVVSQ